MTDTPDIKALREQWETLNERLDLDIFITTVLTALEAERQRADAAEMAAKSYKNIAEVGCREIAALKGDQVPVAFTGSGSLAAIKGGHEGHIWGIPADAHPVPLYDRPQKPVVLPDEMREDILRCVDEAMTGCNSLSAPDYAVRVAGWLAVGGIMKVTDKCHPSLMTSVNVPHNVIRTYFDASGGRNDIVTLSDKREMNDMSSIVKDGE